MDALVQCLAHSLSSAQGQRSDAEQALQQRAYPRNDASGAFGVELAQVFASDAAALPIRQAAGIALKKYVYERWSVFFEEHLRTAKSVGEGGDAVPPDAKHAVHTLLLQALGDAERKVRLLAAQLLSIIGSCDFPDHFPELLPELQKDLGAYASSDPRAADKVHGAMKFLADFVQSELDENQLLVVSKEFIPLLQNILSDTSSAFSAHTKARCVLVFRQCLTSLYTVRDAYADMVKQAVDHYLPPWLEALQAMLDPAFYAQANWADAAAWEVLGLRREVIRTLGVASRFRKHFGARGTEVLGVCLANLEALAPLFSSVDLVEEPRYEEPSAAEGDSDVVSGIAALAMTTLSFFSETLETPSMRELLLSGGTGGEGAATPAFAQLVEALATFAQITREDEETFVDDPSAFVEEDDEENMLVTLRTSTADLLDQLLDVYPLPTLRALPTLVAEVQRLAAMRHATDGTWWKLPEATLMLVGNMHNLIEEVVETMDVPFFQPTAIVHELAVPNLAPSTPSFLRGRSFVFVSQYVGDLGASFGREVFAAAMQVLHAPDAEAPLHVKLSAVRAVRNFAQLSESLSTSDAQAILQELGPLLLQATGSPLVLVMDAIEAALSGAKFAEGDAPVLVDVARAALSAWRTHSMDPQVEISVAALLESLVRIRSAANATVRLALEIAAQALQEDDRGEGLGASAAALARSVLASAEAAALDGAVPHFLPPATQYLLRGSDLEASQSLLFCLTLLWQKRAEDMLAWRGDGVDALELILRIVQEQLQMDEAACSMPLGVLLVTLFLQAGAHGSSMAGLGAVMPGLVRALAAKLATVTSVDAAMALLFPLTYLFAEHTSDVIGLLGHVDVATAHGEANALRVVVAKWLEHAEMAIGRSVGNLNTLALARLLEHWPAELDALTTNGAVRASADNSTYPHSPSHHHALQGQVGGSVRADSRARAHRADPPARLAVAARPEGAREGCCARRRGGRRRRGLGGRRGGEPARRCARRAAHGLPRRYL